MDAVSQLSFTVGIEPACAALGVARASYYRQRPLLGPSPVAQFPVECLARPISARALCAEERQAVRTVLNSERFQDCSPAAVNATLLDEGQYLCSVSTMYRILAEDGASRERRDQLAHPQYQKPELLATAPNQLWSWDITKLRGPAKWTYFYLIVSLGSKRRCEISTVVVARRLWKRLRQAARRRPCMVYSASASPLLRITFTGQNDDSVKSFEQRDELFPERILRCRLTREQPDSAIRPSRRQSARLGKDKNKDDTRWNRGVARY